MRPQLLDPRPYFADLPDPRCETRNKLHKLHDIPAFRIKLSLSFSPAEPSMFKKREYPSSELTTGQ